MKPSLRIVLFAACLLAGTASAQNLSVIVQIDGVADELLSNVLSLLTIKQQADQSLLTEGRMRRLHSEAPDEIRRALAPLGYYRPDIRAELSRSGDTVWVARYSIDAGPPLLIGSVEMRIDGEAADDPVFRQMIDKFPLHEGDVLNHAAYEDAKNGFVKLAAERGYFDADFVAHAVTVDLDRYSADVRLVFASGQRYRFGELVIEQDVLDDALLARFAPFHDGDPYALDKVIELQQALNDSQYFQDVDITLGEEDVAQKTVPVRVQATPRKRHRYTAGAGYGTDTGVRGKLGWEMPRINRRGHRWDSEFRLSEIGNSFSTRYRIPVFNPRTDEVQFSGGVVTEHTDTTISRINTLGTALVHNRGRWRENVSLTYQQERYTIADTGGESTLLMPGIGWSRIWARDRLVPRYGARLIVDFRGASDGMGSDTSFFQSTSHVKFIVPALDRGRFITRGTFGTTLIDEFADLPASVRFFTGGSSTVRGYSYNSLAPRDADGNAVGGKHLVIGSLEYEYSLAPQWAAAAFYDAGNAMDNLSDPLSKGVGAGVRWRSPVGPIRFDVARALTPDDRPWRVHINIGPDL